MTRDVKNLSRVIGFPVTQWPGNCYGLAVMCLNHKAVKGKLRYGHWTGPIHPDSMFRRMRTLGFCRHGWVELSNGHIYDPTRWVFENVKPYIYIGPNDFYDVGGNQYRKENLQPPPAWDPKDKQQTDLCLFAAENAFVRTLLKDSRVEGPFSRNQLFWLANLPIDTLGSFAKAVYEALKLSNCGALIPYDNWKYVME